MRQNNLAELLSGAAVIAMAAGFLFLTYSQTSGPSPSDYDLSVRLGDAGGIKSGSDVVISGIKVGSVSDVSLVGRAVMLHLRLHDDIRVPKDSTASPASGGVLSTGTALGIKPGRSTELLAPGGVIASSG
jgi:phospholipid/cholesterol/gamma-HCH transport system substrate-binding protein